nr:3 hydroxy 3 methylglutaryl coenzyme A reductase [Hymenolepis microstoma]
MVGFEDMGSVHICHTVILILGIATNGDLSHQDFICCGIVLILSDWGSIPVLIKACLTAPMSGYRHFDQENYFMLHSDEMKVFFSAMDNVVLDHFMRLLILNCAAYFFPSPIGAICERLKIHIIVAFLSSFTLLPVLTRINFANSRRNSGFFNFRLSRFIVKESNRTRPEADAAPPNSSSSAFQPVYSGLRQTVHLLVSVEFVVVNLFCSLYSLLRALVLTEFDFWDGKFAISSLWILFGSSLICLTFYHLLKHFLSQNCAYDMCAGRMSRRVRHLTKTEPYEPPPTSAGANVNLLEKYCEVHHSEVKNETVDEDTSPIVPESPKPACAVNSRADEADAISAMSDAEILRMVREGRLKTRELETAVKSLPRAVSLRRQDLASRLTNPLSVNDIPYLNYDYRAVMGQCCEEVIGYIPIPLGKVGPLLLDGKEHYVPMATTEGCLVASTNRGCRALFLAGGVKTALFRDQMTRAPVVFFPSVAEVVKCITWIESSEGFQILRKAFNETSSHADLISVFPNPAGRYLHLRFAARTGEAMGMNMVSKGTERAIRCLNNYFPRMQLISLSGNMCTDKKPATINQIMGRGKSVLAEARIPSRVVAKILHTDAKQLARLTQIKNGTGSAMAGSPGMGSANAHAANLVAAVFAATGQDLAQVVDSSACMTQLEAEPDGSLYVSVTMPCIEVGTVGGGTRLPAQRGCLDMLDLQVERPSEHLARLIAGMVLAGEISLLAALATNDLVQAHMQLNRAAVAVAVATAGNPSTEVASVVENGDVHTTFSRNADHFAM